MTTYTWARGGVLTADDTPCGVLDRGWRRTSATFESDGVTWDFAGAARRRRRELRLADEVLVVASSASMLRQRWRFAGELVCEAVPHGPWSHAMTLRDAAGRVGTLFEPRVRMTGVRLRVDRELPAHHAAFMLWVLERDARRRFTLLDVGGGS